MAKLQGGIVIHRPVHEVFAYATSAESHLRWVPGIREATYLDEDPPHVGSRWRATVMFAGCRLDSVNEVTRVEEDCAFEWRSVGGPVNSTGAYRFVALDDHSTRFEYQLNSDDRVAALIGGFALPLALRLLKRELHSRLERVRDSLEAGEFALA